mgnify:CR=1 FL=1
MKNTTPKEIDFNTSELTIDWKDGERSTFPLEMLRRRCPCAECRRIRATRPEHLVMKSRDIVLLSWSKMGFYGLKLNWSDGHDTGIYTYDFLRGAGDAGKEYPVAP